MPADEPELRERLRILTAALEGIRPRDGQVPRHKVLSATKTFVHLAQLLDNSFTNAFAMTGSTGFPTSDVVLVVSNSKHPEPAYDRDGHTSEGNRDDYSVISLGPRAVPTHEWAEGIIPNPDEIDTKMLAETLLWTWQRLSTLSRGKIRTQFVEDAFQWFHRAAWRRYRSRLVRTTALEWETSPNDTLKTWQPETEDAAIFSGCEGKKLRVSAVQAPHFESFHPESEGDEIVVTFRFRDAVLWTRLFSRVLRTCRTSMDKPPSRDGQPPGFYQSVALLPLLSLLLLFLPIKVLLTRSSLAMQFHRKHTLDADAKGKFEAETESGGDVVERIGDLVDEDVGDEDRDVGPGVRLNGLLVFRFFETLVAPLRALAHLSTRTLPPDDLQPPSHSFYPCSP
ncbi:hypothetical protein PENSPDRAFT_658572 [Peniophora sp. CONT]|nr:hypothetical protein PENSPDRAFT_658572 [Peniophora sp. CONT]